MSGLDGLGWPNPEDEPKTPRERAALLCSSELPTNPENTMNSTRPHVIPIGDKHLHAASEKCWCHPLNKDGVVVHNAKDCREVSERQNVETGKIWVEVLESYQRETKPLAEEVRSRQEYMLVVKMEDALRNHMTNYGGAEYAESAIAAIRAEVGL